MSCDFIALANAGVQGLHPYQPGKPIEELQRELGLSHIVKLASNESPFGLSQMVIEKCQEALSSIALYPDSSAYTLKQALAKKHGVDAEQITLGNGSNQVLTMLANAYLNDSTSAIYSQHAFIVYALAVQTVNAQAIVTPAKNWGHDLDAMLAAVQPNTRMVFIANPNNPTGTWVTHSQILHFMQQVRSDIIVVLDEAYVEYVQEPDYPNSSDLQKQFPNLVVTRTFSKAYGLAGMRLGYSISNKAIANVLGRIREPFNINSLALVAGEAMLSDDDLLPKVIKTNQAGLQQLAQGFDKLGADYIPSVGNFLTLDVSSVSKHSAPELYQKLLEQGVIVRPVGVYDMPNHLRITVSTEQDNAFCLDKLKQVL